MLQTLNYARATALFVSRAPLDAITTADQATAIIRTTVRNNRNTRTCWHSTWESLAGLASESRRLRGAHELVAALYPPTAGRKLTPIRLTRRG